MTFNLDLSALGAPSVQQLTDDLLLTRAAGWWKLKSCNTGRSVAYAEFARPLTQETLQAAMASICSTPLNDDTTACLEWAYDEPRPVQPNRLNAVIRSGTITLPRKPDGSFALDPRLLADFDRCELVVRVAGKVVERIDVKPSVAA
jgi:hypothetical protein